MSHHHINELDQSDIDNPNTSAIDRQLAFVLLLKHNQALLSKSQLPEIKAEKQVAIKRVIADYELNTGIEMTEKQVIKKINNMKNEVKMNTERIMTGEKPLKRKDWEIVLLDLMQAAGCTTYIGTPINSGLIHNGVSVAAKRPSEPENVYLHVSEYSESVSVAAKRPPQPETIYLHATDDNQPWTPEEQEMGTIFPPPPDKRSRVRPLDEETDKTDEMSRVRPLDEEADKTDKMSRVRPLDEETDETRDLSTADLQRLVLLEQLKLIRMQQQQLVDIKLSSTSTCSYY